MLCPLSYEGMGWTTGIEPACRWVTVSSPHQLEYVHSPPSWNRTSLSRASTERFHQCSYRRVVPRAGIDPASPA